jgi:NADPH:quinone reductase-like Zn-dependent oxidoreductase
LQFPAQLFTLLLIMASTSPVDDIDLARPVDYRTLKGKTVAITGGASGFGKAMALQWASKG